MPDFELEWGPPRAVAPPAPTQPPPPLPASAPRERGTDQQEAFWRELTAGSGHVVLEARAGSGKSFSCRVGMARLVEAGVKPGRIRYTAFNKSIADDFRTKAPRGSDVGTFHSFCNQALQRVLPSRPTLDREKSYKALDQVEAGRGPKLSRSLRKSVVKLVGAAKNAAYDPGRSLDECVDDLYTLLDAMDVETFDQDERVVTAAYRVLLHSFAWTDVIDFDDQLWLTWLLKAPHPPCDVFMVDEAQDLNPLQHALLPMLCPSGRVVAVGDPRQSIYAFRGADARSMARLAEAFDARRLPLTYTFRCPKSHVRLAQRWVPDFHAHDSNSEGEIVEGKALDVLVESAEPGDQVVCRRNAPLVKGALQLIAARKPAMIRGRSFGEELTPILRRCDAPTITGVIQRIDAWEAGKLVALADKEGAEEARERISDQSAALRAIAGACSAPAEIVGAITSLFVETEPKDRVVFSSIHRAKGTESRRIFLVHAPVGVRKSRRDPTPLEIEQEENCQYVAHTRSLQTLVHVHA